MRREGCANTGSTSKFLGAVGLNFCQKTHIQGFQTLGAVGEVSLQRARGVAPPQSQLADGMRTEFLVNEGGEIPPFNRQNPAVLNNPHVLEQPPTI